MRNFPRITGVAAAVLALGGTAAHADGEAAKGEKVFAKCKICHAIVTTKNKVGPMLHGVIGRKAGHGRGVRIFAAMVTSGVTRDGVTIAEYVAKPKDFVPGNKMAIVGLKKEDEFENLVAYIQANCCS